MSGSTFGTHFKITTWGESHGAGIGAVVDGCPAGLPLCEEDIQAYLDRRKPGQSKFSTPRKEDDMVVIQSGVFEGKTTGTPISLAICNKNQRSADYREIASYYRPGHADYTFDQKYGFRDYRGGGRSSARETAGRVAAGAIAAKLLGTLDISFCTYVKSIGPVAIDPARFDLSQINENALRMPDEAAAKCAQEYLQECIQAHDSSGGVVECCITGVPAGIGEPVFDKLDANLAKAIFSIGAVKGFEIGSGFQAAHMKGTAHNDSFYSDDKGRVCKKTNHAGGILGGISDGSEIIFRAAFKPTPSIYAAQDTISRQGNNITVQIKGRHDPVVVPRAVVVVESMAALTIADLLLANMGTRCSHISQLYRT